MKTMKAKHKLTVVFLSIVGISILCIGIAYAIINLATPKSFYKNYGDFGAAYIPLVEPYKAVKIFKGVNSKYKENWQIDLIVSPDKKELYYYLYIPNVTEISVEKKVIMAYSPDSISLTDHAKSVGQKILYWFVIVPDKNIETGFETEEEFLNYIHTLGIEKPSWIEPDIAIQQLLKTGCLSWILDCK
jgi:hypothetical protein